MNDDLRVQAQAITDDVAAQLPGFDPLTILTIITTLIPLISGCFKKTSTETPAEYLADHFDEEDGTFDQSLVNRMRPQTRRAARKAGQRHLSRSQLDALSVATLTRAMNEDESTVASVMAAADQMSGVDE